MFILVDFDLQVTLLEMLAGYKSKVGATSTA